MIGRKFILTNTPPYGMFGHNDKIKPLFIEIEVKSNFTFVDEYNETRDSFLADGNDGYKYRFMQNGVWERNCSDEDFEKLSEEEKDRMVKDLFWRDVILFQCPALPDFYADFSAKLKFCETHQNLFYEEKECFYCKKIPDFRRNVQMNLEEHKWLGWYK